MVVRILKGKAAFSTSTTTSHKNDLFHTKSLAVFVLLRKTPNRCLTRSGEIPVRLKEIT